MKHSGTSTAWNDPHQFAAMAAAAANNMENLEMLSSLLGTYDKHILYHKLLSLWSTKENKELELQDKGYETIHIL